MFKNITKGTYGYGRGVLFSPLFFSVVLLHQPRPQQQQTHHGPLALHA